MLPDDLIQHGQHVMTICNACRYCEGYCPVFPAMEERLTFANGDLELPREPLPQLRRVPLRLPVRAAARIRHQRAAHARGDPPRVVRGVLLAERHAPARSRGSRRWRRRRSSWDSSSSRWRRAFDRRRRAGGDFYQVVPHHVMVAIFSAAACLPSLRSWSRAGGSPAASAPAAAQNLGPAQEAPRVRRAGVALGGALSRRADAAPSARRRRRLHDRRRIARHRGAAGFITARSTASRSASRRRPSPPSIT